MKRGMDEVRIRDRSTRHVAQAWERGRPARIDNRGPAAHCGRDARAPRDGSRNAWRECEDVSASRSLASIPPVRPRTLPGKDGHR